MRHAFVHDANLKCDVASEEMAQIERLALKVAQLTTSLLDERFGEHFGIHAHESDLPVFLLIRDLISKWKVTKRETAEQ